MILSADPTVVRKAAAFVEAVEKIEGDFGIDLGASTPILFDVAEVSFGLVRVPGEDRRLALCFPEPPKPESPRYPIHGRD